MRIIVMLLFLIQAGTVFPMYWGNEQVHPQPGYRTVYVGWAQAPMLIPIDPEMDQAAALRIRRAPDVVPAAPALPDRPREQTNEPFIDDSDSERD